MSLKTKVLLREYGGIRGAPSSEESYRNNLEVFENARARSIENGDLTAASHATRGVAESYRRLGRPEEAKRAYGDALHMFRSSSDAAGIAWSLFGLGNLQRQQSDFRAAHITLAESLKLA